MLEPNVISDDIFPHPPEFSLSYDSHLLTWPLRISIMAAETPETVHPSNNGLVGHPSGNTFNAYPTANDPNSYSPNGNGKLPVQGGPPGSSHWDYGGNPLAHANTGDSARFAPFAGYLQPGLYKPPKSGIANPAPLGLMAFAFTTFLLSLINFSTNGVTTPNIVVGPAFAYGGLVQLLAGMW
jgi:GPR1/FUN34/yaaH family